MKRLFIAGAIAIGLHALFLSSGSGCFTGKIRIPSRESPLSLTLVSMRLPARHEERVQEMVPTPRQGPPAAAKKIERKTPRKRKSIPKPKPPRRMSRRPKPRITPRPVAVLRKPETVSPRPAPAPDVRSENKRIQPEKDTGRSIQEEKADYAGQAEENKPITDEIVQDALADVPESTGAVPEQNVAAESALPQKALGVKLVRPLYRKNPRPAYPRLARRRGYQGIVILEVLVRRDGTPGKVRIFHSSGYRILDKAAIKAVKKWSFSPGLENGDPVDVWVKIPIRFQLD